MDKYEVEYLQIFKDDLNEIVSYIVLELKDKNASHKLIDDIQKKIELIKTNPQMYQYYDFIKSLKEKYRCFVVGNYIVFYFINKDEKIITIYRIIYNKRNLKSL